MLVLLLLLQDRERILVQGQHRIEFVSSKPGGQGVLRNGYCNYGFKWSMGYCKLGLITSTCSTKGNFRFWLCSLKLNFPYVYML